jgi:hypothetical protein
MYIKIKANCALFTSFIVHKSQTIESAFTQFLVHFTSNHILSQTLLLHVDITILVESSFSLRTFFDGPA